MKLFLGNPDERIRWYKLERLFYWPSLDDCFKRKQVSPPPLASIPSQTEPTTTTAYNIKFVCGEGKYVLPSMVDESLLTPPRPCVGHLLLCVSLCSMFQFNGFLYQCCLASSLLL